MTAYYSQPQCLGNSSSDHHHHLTDLILSSNDCFGDVVKELFLSLTWPGYNLGRISLIFFNCISEDANLHQLRQTAATERFLDLSLMYVAYQLLVQSTNPQNMLFGRNGHQELTSILYSTFLILFNQLAAPKAVLLQDEQPGRQA